MAHIATKNAGLYRPESTHEKVDSQKMFIDNINKHEENYVELTELNDATNDIVDNNYALMESTIGYTKKNLLNITTTTQTINGITFTVNGDKSVTVNGTATTQTAIITLNSAVTLKAGSYILSGGTTNATLWIETIGDSKGADKLITLTEQKTLRFTIFVEAGVTVNNETVYPMIRHADVIDNTFEPYVDDIRLQLNRKLEASGNIASADKLKTPRYIGNANFDGSEDITQKEMGVTACSYGTISNATTGWVRIAETANDVMIGNFTAHVRASGISIARHTTVTIQGNISFHLRKPTLIVSNLANYGAPVMIQEVRIVYNSTSYIDQKAYLEIRIGNNATTIDTHMESHYTWGTVHNSYIAGSIPSGYTSVNLVLDAESSIQTNKKITGLNSIPTGGSSGQILKCSSDGTVVWEDDRQAGSDTDTTYSTANATTAGISKLYTGTGTNTDGSITQKALTTLFDGKSDTNHTHAEITSLSNDIQAEIETNYAPRLTTIESQLAEVRNDTDLALTKVESLLSDIEVLTSGFQYKSVEW